MNSQPTNIEVQPTAVGNKFQRDEQFDDRFKQKIEGIIWYPYVGKHFGENGKKIMVFAHNATVSSKEYEETRSKWEADKLCWANSKDMEAYAYDRDKNYKAFRNFIKATVRLKKDYGRDSHPKDIERVDSFVDRIAYLNFIQGAVKSDKKIAVGTPEQIEKSKRINCELLRILDVTHCICWGKYVYGYIRDMVGFEDSPDKPEGRRGFSSCVIDVGGGKTMRCLRIFHPSMPGFNPYSDETQSIISRFLESEINAENSNLILQTATESIAAPASQAFQV